MDDNTPSLGHDFMDKSLEELQKYFYARGYDFFCWNSGKNTPNILQMMVHQIGEAEKKLHTLNSGVQGLTAVIENADKSSGALGDAIKRLTTWGLVISILAIAWDVYKTLYLKQ